MDFPETVEVVGKVVEATGVAVIVVGIALAAIRHGGGLFGDEAHQGFRAVRQAVARSILLGLELLIAGDIIRTVAVDPTFASVGVLALIVLVRTFISVELELEINGHWPWERRKE
ncbi:MAG: DUF1622 domain-containing protein [Chloroflexota bacterium]|nr:DUF1622 domain-containing protein [Chloroflexota bacterium]